MYMNLIDLVSINFLVFTHICINIVLCMFIIRFALYLLLICIPSPGCCKFIFQFAVFLLFRLTCISSFLICSVITSIQEWLILAFSGIRHPVSANCMLSFMLNQPSVCCVFSVWCDFLRPFVFYSSLNLLCILYIPPSLLCIHNSVCFVLTLSLALILYAWQVNACVFTCWPLSRDKHHNMENNRYTDTTLIPSMKTSMFSLETSYISPGNFQNP